MKRYVTKEQTNELTDKQLEKLLALYDRIFRTEEEREAIGIEYFDESFYECLERGSLISQIECFESSIYNMIEALKNEYEKIEIVNEENLWYLFLNEDDPMLEFCNHELCDVLWEAIKYMLLMLDTM